MTTLQFPEVRKRVVQARTNLILDEPFFGTLVLRLALVEDPDCPTFWTDGKSLGYNPQYTAGLTDDEIMTVLEHEVLHCANGHPWRRGGRDHQLFNEAADRAINPVLRDAPRANGLTRKLPEGALFELDPTHKGKSTEWVYDRLPRPQAQPQPQQGGGQGAGAGSGGNDSAEGQPKGPSGGPGDGSETPSGRPADRPKSSPSPATQPEAKQSSTGHPANDSRGTQGHKADPFGEVRDAPSSATPDDPAPTEEEWQSAVQQAAVLAKGQGKLPGALKRFAQDAVKPRHDWRSVLRRFVQEMARSDYTFARPNPRYVAHAVYLPSLHNHEVGDLAIAVDTSGSIDQVLLNQFASEIRTIAEEVKPRRIRVLYADARVHSEETFERDDVIQLHPNGGGGTDFRPVFDAIQKWDEPPVAVLYLTDLYGTFPETDPGIPTLWVSTQDRDQRRVPFGELVTAA